MLMMVKVLVAQVLRKGFQAMLAGMIPVWPEPQTLQGLRLWEGSVYEREFRC